MADLTNELPEELLNAKVCFGLVAQGHIPTIEKMLDEGCGWPAIGKAIGWEPHTAAQHYAKYCRAELLRLRTDLADKEREDETPIDAEWLAARGFTILHYSGNIGWRADIATGEELKARVVLTLFSNGRPSICTEHSQLTLPRCDVPQSRGYVTNLCAFLGIPHTAAPRQEQQ